MHLRFSRFSDGTLSGPSSSCDRPHTARRVKFGRHFVQIEIDRFNVFCRFQSDSDSSFESFFEHEIDFTHCQRNHILVTDVQQGAPAPDIYREVTSSGGVRDPPHPQMSLWMAGPGTRSRYRCSYLWAPASNVHGLLAMARSTRITPHRSVQDQTWLLLHRPLRHRDGLNESSASDIV